MTCIRYLPNDISYLTCSSLHLPYETLVGCIASGHFAGPNTVAADLILCGSDYKETMIT